MIYDCFTFFNELELLDLRLELLHDDWQRFYCVPIDKTFPRCIQENLAKYEKFRGIL